MSSASRPTLARQNHSSTTSASHSTAPVRDAVTPLPMDSSTRTHGAAAARIDSKGPQRGRSGRAFGESKAGSHSNSAKALIRMSVACWLRWRRLPMACPSVDW